ncbi:hypothetical protein F8388_022032 [Cannabis sativa]|uniref:RNase H type-1 domain-containing protein n=1 Tax=Cannabis sativa TaxID=3483 RepID=A0A7J6G7H2_CANSA|nr:hypothetical protein F8388_022032 [Cannabis sativa]
MLLRLKSLSLLLPPRLTVSSMRLTNFFESIPLLTPPTLLRPHAFSQITPPPQSTHQAAPIPIMTTSTISHTAKGKGIAFPVSEPPISRPPGIVIQESSTRSSPTSSVGTRKHFTRQSTQVGDSVITLLLPGEASVGAPNFSIRALLGKSHLDYQEAQAIPSTSHHSVSHCSAVLDQVLTPTSTALFVDAALNTHNPATGFGLVFMQGLSQVHQSTKFFRPGASSPLFAEAQALYEGLKWCVASNLQPRFVFSDCLNLITKVNGNWQDNSSLSSLVQRIRTFLSSFPEATLMHVKKFPTLPRSTPPKIIRKFERASKSPWDPELPPNFF